MSKKLFNGRLHTQLEYDQAKIVGQIELLRKINDYYGVVGGSVTLYIEDGTAVYADDLLEELEDEL